MITLYQSVAKRKFDILQISILLSKFRFQGKYFSLIKDHQISAGQLYCLSSVAVLLWSGVGSVVLLLTTVVLSRVFN